MSPEPTSTGSARPRAARAPQARLRRAALRIALAVSAGSALSAGCAGLAPSYGIDLPVASRYVYRGAVFNRDPVVQPEAHATIEDEEQSLTLGVFTSFETSDENDAENDFTELDPYVDYGRQVGPLYVSLGQTLYVFPNTGLDPTSEVYVILSSEVARISAALETWYDYVEADGLYFNLNVGRELALSERTSLALSAGVGYMGDGQAEYYFGVDRSGFSDAQVQATLAFALAEHVSLSLVGAYASVIDHSLRDAVDDPDNAWMALGTSITF